MICSAWVELTDIDRFLRCIQFWNISTLGEAIIELFDRDIFFRLAATDEGVVERTRITLLHADKILLHVQGLSQKNKFVIYSTTYTGWGGTHPLPVGAGFHARPLLRQPPHEG
ncbi:MAG: hypothetical protein C0396_01245 [Anaerolinea sp.]|nr:hypothetical protein [Anaerolinea sp.]